MNINFHNKWSVFNEKMKNDGTWKTLKYLSGPMDGIVKMEGEGEVIILSSNNYLGLANNPDVISASRNALEKYGAGTSSVRFICGSFDIHRELEDSIADFLGMESSITYVSCWNANTGAIPLLAGEGDVIVSDELNHASIIDGIRLSRAERKIYSHSDMKSLEAKLQEALSEKKEDGTILIITDGVFSMEGDLAKLPEIADLADKYNAAVMVDDSHGTGVLGKTGRGTVEYYGLEGEIDIITGTLGKALGGAAGGFAASSTSVVDALIQASRPQIFSNALPASTAAGALEAINQLKNNPEILKTLKANTEFLRNGLKKTGFKPIESESAIIPIIIGETSAAIDFSRKLLDKGVFVTGFGYPVVPEGTARIRIQSSAALKKEDMEKALDAFAETGKETGIL